MVKSRLGTFVQAGYASGVRVPSRLRVKRLRCCQIKNGGACMKTFLWAGKLLTLLFWGVVLLNLIQPFATPFALLLNAAGALVLVAHALELWLFDKRVAVCANPYLERVWVMVFGIFHLAGLPAQSIPPLSEPQQREQSTEAENA